jgi:hypothetical protein
MTTFAIVVVWLACGVGAGGFLNASWRADFASLAKDPAWGRKNLGECMLLGLLGGPVMLIISFFTSGFGYHGWSLAYEPPS